jgi:hypothetical protein
MLRVSKSPKFGFDVLITSTLLVPEIAATAKQDTSTSGYQFKDEHNSFQYVKHIAHMLTQIAYVISQIFQEYAMCVDSVSIYKISGQ